MSASGHDDLVPGATEFEERIYQARDEIVCHGDVAYWGIRADEPAQLSASIRSAQGFTIPIG